MSNQSRQIASPANPFGWPLLRLPVLLVGVLFAFANWPVAQMVAIAAVGIAFMLVTMIRTLRTTAAVPACAMPARWYQFNLRTLLLWIVPYAATMAGLATWHGPYEQDFLNANVKGNARMVFTQIVVSTYTITSLARAKRDAKSETSPGR